jgi:hypothetical protein
MTGAVIGIVAFVVAQLASFLTTIGIFLYLYKFPHTYVFQWALDYTVYELHTRVTLFYAVLAIAGILGIYLRNTYLKG